MPGNVECMRNSHLNERECGGVEDLNGEFRPGLVFFWFAQGWAIPGRSCLPGTQCWFPLHVLILSWAVERKERYAYQGCNAPPSHFQHKKTYCYRNAGTFNKEWVVLRNSLSHNILDWQRFDLHEELEILFWKEKLQKNSTKKRRICFSPRGSSIMLHFK